MPCPEYLFIDLDETIIMHETAFCSGHRSTESLTARLLELKLGAEEYRSIQNAMETQYYSAPIRFVEERWNTLVRELKTSGVKVFGLTSNGIASPYTQQVLQFLRK